MEKAPLGPVLQGPPKQLRLEREMAVYRLLTQLDIPFARLDHSPVMTAADGACDAIDEALGIPNVKNLFLRNANRTRYFLVALPAEKRLDLKKLARQLEVSHLSFGEAEQMEAFLGLQPGAVSVMGLMHDKENRVQLILDEQVAKQPVLGCHPCVNTSSLRLAMADFLEKFLPAVGHGAICLGI